MLVYYGKVMGYGADAVVEIRDVGAGSGNGVYVEIRKWRYVDWG